MIKRDEFIEEYTKAYKTSGYELRINPDLKRWLPQKIFKNLNRYFFSIISVKLTRKNPI